MRINWGSSSKLVGALSFAFVTSVTPPSTINKVEVIPAERQSVAHLTPSTNATSQKSLNKFYLFQGDQQKFRHLSPVGSLADKYINLIGLFEGERQVRHHLTPSTNFVETSYINEFDLFQGEKRKPIHLTPSIIQPAENYLNTFQLLPDEVQKVRHLSPSSTGKPTDGVYSGRIVATTNDINDEYLQNLLRDDEEILLVITAFMGINQ